MSRHSRPAETEPSVDLNTRVRSSVMQLLRTASEQRKKPMREILEEALIKELVP